MATGCRTAATWVAAAMLAVGGCSSADENPRTGVPSVLVDGIVLDDRGDPRPGATIWIDGHAPVTSNQVGRFRMNDVAVPYDLTVITESGESERRTVVLYEGITRYDPTLWAGSLATPRRSARITGSIDSPKLVTPETDAKDITLDTIFHWTSPESSLFSAQIDVGDTLSYTIVTSRRDVRLPNLKALGIGLPRRAPIRWSAANCSPIKHVDDLVAPIAAGSDIRTPCNDQSSSGWRTAFTAP